MACAGSLQLSYNLGLCRNQGFEKQFKSARGRVNCHLLRTTNDSCTSFLQQDLFSIDRLRSPYRPIYSVRCRSNAIRGHVSLLPSQVCQLPVIKAASTAFTRSCNTLYGHPLMIKLAPAVCIIIFAVCGLGPLMRKSRNLLLHKNDNSWKKSTTNHVATSYIQPLLLWIGAILICRELDPIVLPTEASQVVKQRVVNFVRSLSTVLAFAYCFSSMIQQAQKYYMETTDSSNTREMSFQFAGKAVYTAVWVASISLFMELLGFSTQRLLTAGGLGTVLLTLAGREIFINFLSGAMIHATRPFVANEWIQTKIEGYEVSGTVEHVGWWSPTIIRGENREAIHIPNHKFTVNVVRNLSQKTHWRIKTHLAISHVDVNKIHNIVADMRKVLAKNPQVEQQRLHRRVFLENVNLENQALTILVSCFVKTSHHEEYLCVKEAILLDLLRVIGHHRARLATPIRTIQKSYYDADLDNIPFADSVHDHGVSAKHPLLLIEPQYKIYGEDKTKSQSRSTNTRVKSDTKVDAKVGATPKSDPKADNTKVEETSDSDSKDHPSEQASTTDRKVGDNKVTKPTSKSTPKTNSKISETSNSVSKGPVPDNITKDKKVQDSQPKSRAILEDNIVLGVALEGSKRTLPIGEDVDAASSVEVKESAAASWNGNGSSNSENEKQDGQNPGSRSANSGCSITS